DAGPARPADFIAAYHCDPGRSATPKCLEHAPEHRPAVQRSERLDARSGCGCKGAVDSASRGDDRFQEAGYFLAIVFFLPATVRFGPLRVRAFVLVRCPRTGRPRRCRMPR